MYTSNQPCSLRANKQGVGLFMQCDTSMNDMVAIMVSTAGVAGTAIYLDVVIYVNHWCWQYTDVVKLVN